MHDTVGNGGDRGISGMLVQGIAKSRQRMFKRVPRRNTLNHR
jgi:hypothetical protein